MQVYIKQFTIFRLSYTREICIMFCLTIGVEVLHDNGVFGRARRAQPRHAVRESGSESKVTKRQR